LTIGQEFAKKIAFPQLGISKSPLISFRLEISSPGTLFAFMQFLIAYTD
jgi:hypothetical protein